MKQGISQLRNPVIARVFRELELVEQWGSGIPGIFRQAAYKNTASPQKASRRARPPDGSAQELFIIVGTLT